MAVFDIRKDVIAFGYRPEIGHGLSAAVKVADGNHMLVAIKNYARHFQAFTLKELFVMVGKSHLGSTHIDTVGIHQHDVEMVFLETLLISFHRFLQLLLSLALRLLVVVQGVCILFHLFQDVLRQRIHIAGRVILNKFLKLILQRILAVFQSAQSYRPQKLKPRRVFGWLIIVDGVITNQLHRKIGALLKSGVGFLIHRLKLFLLALQAVEIIRILQNKRVVGIGILFQDDLLDLLGFEAHILAGVELIKLVVYFHRIRMIRKALHKFRK